jgi:mRNA interferase MazF
VVNRGEIWLVALDPTVGSEIQKTRPCVVVSPREMNSYVRTVLVASFTTSRHPVSFRIPVRHAAREGLILLDQIRAVDKLRLVERTGTLDAKTLTMALDILCEIFEE